MYSIDMINSKYNIGPDYTLLQGSKSEILDFEIKREGTPIILETIIEGETETVVFPAVVCYIVYYDRLDFKRSIRLTSIGPETFAGDLDNRLIVRIDTSVISEVLDKPNKVSVMFKIDENYTTLLDFNVTSNPAYTVFN